MAFPPVSLELAHLRHEPGFAKPFGPKLPHERQPRGREQHLLSHGRRVGDVRDGDDEAVRPGRGMLPKEDVERYGRAEVRAQEREVAEEGGAAAAAGDGVQRDEGFVGYGGEETALRGVGDEGVKGRVEVGRGWKRAVRSCCGGERVLITCNAGLHFVNF